MSLQNEYDDIYRETQIQMQRDKTVTRNQSFRIFIRGEVGTKNTLNLGQKGTDIEKWKSRRLIFGTLPLLWLTVMPNFDNLYRLQLVSRHPATSAEKNFGDSKVSSSSSSFFFFFIFLSSTIRCKTLHYSLRDRIIDSVFRFENEKHLIDISSLVPNF